MKSPYTYISVMGTMGVGKSTATKLLADHFGYTHITENFSDNLFLPRFYKDMKRWAFHSQTFFLMEKITQMVEVKKLLHTKNIVQDTPILQDAFSYAQAHHILGNIDDAEWELYTKIYRQFEPLFPKITLLVYLDAPISTVMERIKSRGRGYEQEIPVTYVRLLDNLNKKLLASYKRKVITIQTKNLNIVSSTDAQKRFIQKVEAALKGSM